MQIANFPYYRKRECEAEMKCKNCGSAIREGTSFCLNCGAQVETKKRGRASGLSLSVIVLACSLSILIGVIAYALPTGRLAGDRTSSISTGEKDATETVSDENNDAMPREDGAGTNAVLLPKGDYGYGFADYEELRVYFDQVGVGVINLYIYNRGSNRLELGSKDNDGIPMYAVGENGERVETIVTDFGGSLLIDPYGETSICRVRFIGLKGKIKEVGIMNIRYSNPDDSLDSGSMDGPLVIEDMST